MVSKLRHTNKPEQQMTTIERHIQEQMTRYNMSREQVIEMNEKWGEQDGKASKNFKNPAHKNWPEAGNYNLHYERGYWKGYNS